MRPKTISWNYYFDMNNSAKFQALKFQKPTHLMLKQFFRLWNSTPWNFSGNIVGSFDTFCENCFFFFVSTNFSLQGKLFHIFLLPSSSSSSSSMVFYWRDDLTEKWNSLSRVEQANLQPPSHNIESATFEFHLPLSQFVLIILRIKKLEMVARRRRH